MSKSSNAESIRERLDAAYRNESRPALATLIRILGDFDLAEEALHDAFTVAVEQWPRDGVPDNPRAWLVSTGRFKAIDKIRRRARFDASQQDIADQLEARTSAQTELDAKEVQDDHLRLIFTCCHPALASDAQVAMTLREVCGLSTEEIASAFLVMPSTIAQRIVRAKNKIRDAGIPYELPTRRDLPERLNSVLQVIYLVYNEGYSASAGDSLTRTDLADQAIRLGRQLVELLPEAEAVGLLALMLLHDSRRQARTSESGDIVLLEDQDRRLWNGAQIVEGKALVEQALSSKRFGPYALQAAIAALHAEAESPQATDWAQIVDLYTLLMRVAPSPIVELNRAVAVAMHEGAGAGLALIDRILERGELDDYALAHAARADLLRRIGDLQAASAAYRKALELTAQGPQRRFLEQRLKEVSSNPESVSK